MGYVKMNCPSCGAAIEISGDKEFFFCQYCGTKIVKDKQFVEIKGPVSVAGIANENSLLDRAFLFLEDGNFSDGNKYLEKVLDINPRCSKAYIGKLMCQTESKVEDDLTILPLELTHYEYFNKALRFADENELKHYNNLSESSSSRIDSAKSNKLRDIENAKKEVRDDTEYLNVNKKDYQKCVAKQVMWKVLLVLSILFSSILLICTIIEPGIAVLLVPCVIWMIFMIKKNKDSKKTTMEYDRIKNLLPQKQASVFMLQGEYERWLESKERYL